MLALSGSESDAPTDSAVIGAVYFEEVRRHLGVDAAHVYGGLLATLTAWCERHQIPYQGVPVGTIKRHATGKGNAGKAEVIAAMKALGHPVTQPRRLRRRPVQDFATVDRVDGPPLGRPGRPNTSPPPVSAT
jgi:hypothetical protein